MDTQDTEQPPDDHLLWLVDAINGTNPPRRLRRWQNPPAEPAAIWVILTMSSLAINGELIPAWQWWDEQSTHRRKVVGQPAEDDLVVRLSENRSQHYRELAQQRAERSAGSPTRFIHLREARLYSPGSQPLPGKGLLWRGRLSAITGWSLGRVGERPEQEA